MIFTKSNSVEVHVNMFLLDFGHFRVLTHITLTFFLLVTFVINTAGIQTLHKPCKNRTLFHSFPLPLFKE